MKHTRKLAAVFPAVLLLNHACGAAANLSVPANAVSTLIPAEETTPVLATTAQESATPTKQTLLLEVLEWHRWPEPLEEYDVERGWSNVYALVRNPHEFAVEVAGAPTARLFNSAGEFVYRSLGADVLDGSLMAIGQIPPGETIGISFCACGTAGTVAVPDWETFELDFDLRETAAVALSTDFKLTPIDVRQGEYFSVIYTLAYSGQQPLRAIAVRLTVRDQEGAYIGSGEVGILGMRNASGYAPIQPGTAFDFSGINEDPPAVSILLDPAYKNQTLTYELSAVGSLAEK